MVIMKIARILCLIFCAATAALAQTTFTPISNLSQPFGEDVGVWSGLSHAASFTTGNTAASLFSVSVSMDAKQSGIPQNFDLSLYSDASGSPGSILATLSGNIPFYAGIYAYTNTSPLVLSANTTYWIVASSPDTLSGEDAYKWILTFSPALDSGSFWTMGVSKYNQGSGWQPISDGDFLQFSVTVTNPQPPAVFISQPVVLTFPTNGFPFILQQNSNLSTTNWVNVTNATLSGVISIKPSSSCRLLASKCFIA